MNLPTVASAEVDPVSVALLAEDLGFDFVSSSDHPGTTRPTNETWTMLTWVAASTQRLNLATRVLGTPFRLPAITVKMAETLNRLSGWSTDTWPRRRSPGR